MICMWYTCDMPVLHMSPHRPRWSGTWCHRSSLLYWGLSPILTRMPPSGSSVRDSAMSPLTNWRSRLSYKAASSCPSLTPLHSWGEWGLRSEVIVCFYEWLVDKRLKDLVVKLTKNWISCSNLACCFPFAFLWDTNTLLNGLGGVNLSVGKCFKQCS